MDNWWHNIKNSLIGGIQSNLYNGPIWFTIKPNYFLALEDPNLNRALGLKIKIHGMQDLHARTKNIAINYILMYRVVNTVIRLSKPVPEIELNKCSHSKISIQKG